MTPMTPYPTIWTSGTRFAAWLLAAAMLCCVLMSGSQAEALEVRVRAQSSLDANIAAAGTTVHVSGSLRDELNLGLPQRRIEVAYRPQEDVEGAELSSETLHTDRRGRFETRRELAPGSWQITVSFEATEHVTQSRLERTVVLSPAPVHLRIQAPPRIIGTAENVPLRARASVGGVGLSARADVQVNGRSVGSIELDQFGRGSIDIADEIQPGNNEVTLGIAGSAHREPVEQTVEVRLSEHLDVEASFEQVVERLQRGLAVEGVARDGLGPVENLRVTVRLRREGQKAASADENGQSSEDGENGENGEGAEGEEPGQSDESDETDGRRDEAAALERHVTTDSQGRFHAFFSGESLEDGVWHAETVIVPEIGPELSVPTEPVDLNRRTSRWILNALGLLGLLGAVALILQRLWTVIAAQLERRRQKRQSRSRSEEAFAETERLVPRQLDEDQVVDTKPDRRRVSGLVWDVWKAQPLGEAELVLSTADGEPVRTQTSSAGGAGRRGGFVFDSLEPGEYLLEIDAVGFMPGQLSLRIPHEGTLSNVRLDLVAVPLKIRRLYQSLVETLEGEDLWGRLSPRQIEDTLVRSAEVAAPREDSIARREFVRGLRRRLEDAPEELTGEGLAAMMTDLVEETYFSGRVFDASIWRLSRDIAVRLRERFEEEDAS